MKPSLVLPAFLALGGCSGSPMEQQDEATVAEIEKQIEAEAKSLEEAADQAVKVLEAEIDAELADDGIGQPERPADNPADDGGQQ